MGSHNSGNMNDGLNISKLNKEVSAKAQASNVKNINKATLLWQF